jgi:hypothetical protein
MLINTIFIKSSDYDLVKKSLTDWIKLYANGRELGFEFKLYQSGTGNYILTCDAKLDNELFIFLVNYLVYPVDIEEEREVIGFTLAANEEVFPEQLRDKQVMFFIPSSDTEYDVICWTTEDGQVYKTDLGFATIPVDLTKPFIVPHTDLEQLGEPEKLYM